MSIEALWYSSFRTVRRHGGGEEKIPPISQRMCRMPAAEQWAAIIDLAVEIATGEAGWRHACISLTRERYWYFQGGWWLLTSRHEERARRLVKAATETEFRRAFARGECIIDPRHIAARLRLWRASGRWQRIAGKVASLRLNEPKMRALGRGSRRKTYPILP